MTALIMTSAGHTLSSESLKIRSSSLSLLPFNLFTIYSPQLLPVYSVFIRTATALIQTDGPLPLCALSLLYSDSLISLYLFDPEASTPFPKPEICADATQDRAAVTFKKTRTDPLLPHLSDLFPAIIIECN